MSLWSLLRHRLQAAVRAPFVGRQALSLVFGGLMALYLGGGLVLLGLAFDDLVRAAAPSANPLLVASRGALPARVVYAVLRVFVESGLGVDPRPYLPLPLRRSTLLGGIAVLALVSAWNAVPLAFVLTVGVEAAMNGATAEALRFGGVCLGVLAAVTCAVPMLRRFVSVRPLLAVGGGLLVVGSAGLEWVNGAGGVVSLLDVSGWLLGGAVAGRALPTIGTVVLLGGMGAVYVRWLRKAMAVDVWGQKGTSSRQRSDRLDTFARYGPAVQEAVLELRLVLRNAMPRFSLFGTFFIAGAAALLGYFVDGWVEVRKLLSGTQIINTIMWQGVFGTGAFVILYGGNFFSWEAGHFEATMARPISARHRIDGKLLLSAASVVACFLLAAPVFVATGSPAWAFHTSFALYNLGVLVPAMTAAATFNRTALEPNEQIWLGETNFSGGRVAFGIPVLGLPFAVLGLTNDLTFGLALLGGIGGISALALPLWRRGLVALYRRNRHAMARGFRASRE